VYCLLYRTSCSTPKAGPGSFPIDAMAVSPDDPGMDLVREHLGVGCLSGQASLIGQLCPGLRLCLAAEVATGLMCDRWAGVSACWVSLLTTCLVLQSNGVCSELQLYATPYRNTIPYSLPDCPMTAGVGAEYHGSCLW
jgi:hypothetical protein